MAVIDDKTRIKKGPQVAAQGLGASEGGVLLHLKSGQYHGVDNVGWVIWGLLDGSRDVAELADELRHRFPNAPDQLTDDVKNFIQGLLERELVEILAPNPEV